MKKTRIILASASPRRRELLAQIGMEFEVMVSNVEERVTATLPGEIVQELSEQKASAVLAMPQAKEGETEVSTLVIGADTIVACDNKILGKPADEEDAKRMLRLLSGRTHEVYTGVTMLFSPQSLAGGPVRRHTFFECTKVCFAPMTEAEIDEYVATKDPMDKAGAYGIQGFCARYIKGIEGDYNNVVGLPVGRLYQELKGWLENEESSDI